MTQLTTNMDDKYGEVFSPRHSDHRGLSKFDEQKEFNDNEYKKDLECVDVEQDQESDGDKRERQ
jgi:hypothetical protein